MLRSMLTAAVAAVAVALSGLSADAGLFSRRGGDCCGAVQVAPACGGCQTSCCDRPKRVRFKRSRGCCAPAPSCCAPVAAPSCCAPVVAPVCAAPAPTCCAPVAPSCCAPMVAPSCAAPAVINGGAVAAPAEQAPAPPAEDAPPRK